MERGKKGEGRRGERDGGFLGKARTRRHFTCLRCAHLLPRTGSAASWAAPAGTPRAGAGTGASTASQPRVSAPQPPGVCPAAPGFQPEGRGKVSSAGGAQRARDSRRRQKRMLPLPRRRESCVGETHGPRLVLPTPCSPHLPTRARQAALGSSERNANRLYLGSPSKRGLWFLRRSCSNFALKVSD